MPLNVPKYRDLPIRPDAPAGSAWGVFDKDGKLDALGTLNFITGEAVVAAKEEIQTGESVVLNLPLQLPYNPHKVGRIDFEHTLIPRAHGMYCCDDMLKLNTQSSSQWDGLLHFAHQTRQEYYNGVKYADAVERRTDLTLGMQCISERGGIVGRGVLLDFVRYAEKRGIQYDPLSSYPITLTQIKEIIEEEGLKIRQGDVLIIRSGLSRLIRASTPESRGPFDKNEHIGVDPTPELLEWIWDQNLAAVGGDAMAFEMVPATDNSFMRFHEACLPGWGMPIGELLDLEALAEVAEKNKRWSFFLTVCPLNVEGGVATLANTLAVF